MRKAIRVGVWLVAATISSTAFQRNQNQADRSIPRFEQFPTAHNAKFTGTPANPQLRGPGQRMYRMMIRQAAKKGPNFAGHYTVAEWGCGTACEQIAIVDYQTGNVFDGPFGALPKGVVYFGPNVEEDKTGLFYRINSSLFIVAGCPRFKDCGTYYYEWTGTQFRLLRRIPMKALYGSEDYDRHLPGESRPR